MALEGLQGFAKRKPVVYGGIVVGLTAVGWVWYRKKSGESINPFSSSGSNSASSTSSTSATSSAGIVTDPATGLTYSDTAVDPDTNQSYASEIASYGSVAAADQALSGLGTNGGGGSATNELPTGYYSDTATAGTTTTSGQNIYQSNSAWAQAVQAGLEDVSGSTSYDGTDIGTALGAFLQGEPLTTAQAKVISVAEAEFGSPPVGNLQVILQPTNVSTNNAGPGPSPTPKPTTVTVPNVIGRTDLNFAEGIITAAGLTPKAAGDSGVGNKGSVTSQSPTAGSNVAKGSTVTLTYTVKAATTKRPATPTGVKATATSSSAVRVSWNKVPGATSYRVHLTTGEKASGGSGVTRDFDTSGTSVTVTGLRATTTYTVHVIAVNSAGESAETNGPSVKTK